MSNHSTQQKADWANARDHLREYAGTPMDPTIVAHLFREMQDEGFAGSILRGASYLCERLAGHLKLHAAKHTPAKETECICQSCGCSDQPARKPVEWTPQDEDLFTLVEQLLGPIASRQTLRPNPMIHGDPILEEFVSDSTIVWIYNHLRSNGEPGLAIRYWHYAKGIPFYSEDWVE